MKITPTNINNIAQDGLRSMKMNFCGQCIPVKREVIWAATSLSNQIRTRLEGNRLHLFEYDYRGVHVDREAGFRTLRFLNPDIEELTLPETFICPMADELLQRVGVRLLLEIKDFDPESPQLKSKLMHLYVGIDPQEGKTYGILVLNS